MFDSADRPDAGDWHDPARVDAELAAIAAGGPPQWGCDEHGVDEHGVDEPNDDGADDDAAVLERLAAQAPGWGTVAEVASVRPESLDERAALTYLEVVSQAQAWLESLTHRGLVAAAGASTRRLEVPPTSGHPRLTIVDPMREEIAAVLRLAPSTAQSRIDVARILHRLLPQTRAALASGAIGGGAARALAETLTGSGLGWHVEPDAIDPDLAARFEQRALPTAMRDTVGRARSHARRVYRSLDPTGAAARLRRARAARDVHVRHEPDGVSVLTAWLGTEDAHRIATAIDRLAGDLGFAAALHDPDADRIGVRRAAALTALVDTGTTATSDELRAGAAARPATHGAEVHLVMDLAQWLALNDSPVEVLEGGCIPADVAQELAGDATLRRLITDPLTGHLLDVGRAAYRPPAALTRYLRARDGTCRAPGCSRRAAACQVDHVTPWESGGSTAASNTAHDCTRHHQLKTHGGWGADLHADGTVEWTTPHGRTHTTAPAVIALPAEPPPGARAYDDPPPF